MSDLYSTTNAFINSKNRINGSSTSFTAYVPMATNTHIQYDKVCVLSLRIPKTYYMVTSGMNQFALLEGPQNAMVGTLINFPVGNYTIQQFIDELTTLLNAGSVIIGNSLTYIITYSTITGKFTFNNQDPTIYSKFQFTSPNTIGSLFGFSLPLPNQAIAFNLSITFQLNDIILYLGSYYTCILSSIGNLPTNTTYFLNLTIYNTSFFRSDTLLYSDNVVNFNGNNTLFLISNICDSHTNNINRPVLLEIDTDVTIGEDIVWRCYDIEGYSRDLGVYNNSTYVFTLTDSNGTIINLNGNEFNFSLLLYKKDDTNILFRNQLKLKESRDQEVLLEKELKLDEKDNIKIENEQNIIEGNI